MGVYAVLLTCCATLYFALASVIVWQSRRLAPALMGVCCLITAGWAAIGLVWPGEVSVLGAADLVRATSWFGLLFFLYHDSRLGSPLQELGFAAAGALGASLGLVALAAGPSALQLGGMPLAIMARLLLAVIELLLIENLYLNLPPHARWHVALPSVLLGGLACFDILLCAELVIFHASTPGLVGARMVGMIIIAPLLAVAATRGQRWVGRVKLSRSAAFHSATLMLSGSVLLALGLAGEVFRHLSGDWGWLAQVSLAFAATMGLGLLLTSASARSRFQRLFIDHFFAERYDYRRQWQACIRTLSGEADDLVESHERGQAVAPAMQRGLATRVIRTIASVVDSPSGVLYLREVGRGGTGPFHWAGSWNMPATEAVAEAHPIVAAMRGGTWIARLDEDDGRDLAAAPLDSLGPLRLAIPLVHQGAMIGFVLSSVPRAPFSLEQEVFDLLRIVAQEVTTYVAEQRATQTLLQTRDMHDYSKRFAFVAHDIKNVSSQLGLLLSNAESHIANPEFQQDMLETVRSSVRKITALLERLERPEADSAPGTMSPLPRLEALVATYRRVRKAAIVLEHDGSTGSVAMGADAFEAAVTHLLNNAVEASAAAGPGRPRQAAPVTLRVRHEARQVVVEVEDHGTGMSAEFVRDALFHPFSTSKAGGSGIGAYQARELAREAGGDVVVTSVPGAGTTMRLLLPRTDSLSAVNPAILAGALSRAEA